MRTDRPLGPAIGIRLAMRLRRLLIFASALVTLAVGCGGGRSTSRPPGDDEARRLIAEVLDAWKQGGASRALARRTPQLRFVDPDLDAGMKLVEYRIEPTSEAYDYVIDVPVGLTLLDRRGRTVSRNAIYQVTTQPLVAVLRNDP